MSWASTAPKIAGLLFAMGFFGLGPGTVLIEELSMSWKKKREHQQDEASAAVTPPGEEPEAHHPCPGDHLHLSAAAGGGNVRGVAAAVPKGLYGIIESPMETHSQDFSEYQPFVRYQRQVIASPVRHVALSPSLSANCGPSVAPSPEFIATPSSAPPSTSEKLPLAHSFFIPPMPKA